MEINKDVFDKMSKNDIWELFNKLQAERISLDEIKSDTSATLAKFDVLEARVEVLESELAITKNANSLFKKEIGRLEKKVLADNQYGRQENVEINGIPAKHNDSDLEDIVIGIASEIGVELEACDISACHRLGGARGDVIVRFVNRKAADAMFRNASKLKGLDLSPLIGNNHSPVYVNPNLSPELKSIRWKAKKLKEAGKIARFGTSKRGVYVQEEERGAKIQVYIDDDLLQFLGDTPLAVALDANQ